MKNLKICQTTTDASEKWVEKGLMGGGLVDWHAKRSTCAARRGRATRKEWKREGKGAGEGRARARGSVAVNLVGDLSPGESGHFLRGLGNRKWVKNRKTIGEANEGHKPTGK